MEYKIGKPALAGTIMKGTILSVEEGVVKDYVADLTKWSNTEPDQKCMNLSIGAENGRDFTRLFTVNVSAEGEISPMSNLGKFFTRYGKFPEANMQVSLVVNAKGWLDLLI